MARAREWQHRKNRSQGGKWAAANGLDLCSRCHRVIHTSPEKAYSMGWSVRASMNPADMPAMLRTDYGRQYVWLHDDGTKDLADTSGVLALLLDQNGGLA
jgi:hypothetical protein